MMGREYLPSSRSSQKPFAFVYCAKVQRCQRIPADEARKIDYPHLLIRDSDYHRGSGNIGLKELVGRINPFQGSPSNEPA